MLNEDAADASNVKPFICKAMIVKKYFMANGEQEPDLLYYTSTTQEDDFLEDFEDQSGYCVEKDEVDNDFSFSEMELIPENDGHFMCEEMSVETFLKFFEPYT
jgi:hypothetical protein